MIPKIIRKSKAAMGAFVNQLSLLPLASLSAPDRTFLTDFLPIDKTADSPTFRNFLRQFFSGRQGFEFNLKCKTFSTSTGIYLHNFMIALRAN